MIPLAVPVFGDHPNLAEERVVESRNVVGRDPVFAVDLAADLMGFVLIDEFSQDVELGDVADVRVPLIL